MYFKKYTGFAVVEDSAWPKMWRVKKPDGTLTDRVNLARGKDAARVLADRLLRPR